MSKNKIYPKLFKKFDNMILLYSTKKDGAIEDKDQIIKENLDKFLAKNGINSEDAIFMEQTHGNKIKIINNKKNIIIKDVDAMITNKKNTFLCIKTADCLPIVFYEPKAKIIAVAHAGYKGIIKGIIEKTIEKLEKIGAIAQNIYVHIGPSIGGCCYKVKKDRASIFEKKGLAIFRNKAEDYFLDLKEITLNILLNQGLKKGNIEISPICTKCNPLLLFSYRAHKTQKRFVTVIGMI